jgi:hypothetical protein
MLNLLILRDVPNNKHSSKAVILWCVTLKTDASAKEIADFLLVPGNSIIECCLSVIRLVLVIATVLAEVKFKK